MISGLLGLQTEDAYHRARKILKDRFGDPFKVYEAYRRKLRAWPICSTATELQEFSDFLVMTEETMRTVKYLKEFDNFSAIPELAARLPTYYTNKWRDNAKRTDSKQGDYTFHDFVSYVQEAASDATHPVFSHEALAATRKEIQQGVKTKPKRPPSDKKGDNDVSFGTTFATSAGNDENRPSQNKTKCFLCLKPHELEHCQEFLKKAVTERKAFARAKGLCFACLARGHMTRQCEQKKRCRICKKPHVTALHLYEPVTPKKDEQLEGSNEEETAKATSSCVSVCHANNCNATINTKSALIVPVWLHHKNNPELETQVYAVLDDQSDTCFVTNETCEKLGLTGPEVTLQLGTKHAVENINTMKINGLIISRHDKLVNIELPKSYTRDQIPARKEQIPRPETAQAWKHLRSIANKIPPYYKDLKVGVLIGNNCVQAIKPREVIPGRPRDPYAIRTALGWGLIGASLSSSESERDDGIIVSDCFRISTKEIGLEETPTRSFVQQTQCKEVINPFTVSKMFERDFSEGQGHCKTLSQEDKRFLQKMKDGIHLTKDHHYEMPLPFRQDKLELPSNRKTAETRLHQLKRRFARDPKYKKDYVSFMNDMIKAGCAERAPKKSAKSWYIPHHGVYHPKKSGKIRVVFDCSAEFEGQSLNRQLLQGPDLTNSLLGVLCRFRQEPVAFACDIEGMFHQVKVNEEHRDYLRFLWWDQGDTTKDPVEYRMTVHLFGAGSSPGCANLALKTTAEDNERKFGTETAEFLSKNFYVDDGLKSVKTVEEAISLIEKSKLMCKEGGFRLHKFISNRKEVIEAIPTEDRAKDIKDLDLEHDELPSERVLGIEWCVENDAFQFRITLKDKPFTRRGILSTVSSIYDPLGFAAPFLLQGKKILQELCKGKVEWDDPVPEELRARWDRWRSELSLLEGMKIPRCYKPNDFGELKSVEIHHFSDASTDGYGQCSYLRLVDDKDHVHCSFLLGKARVTPLKPVTIPRLELTAAVVFVRVSQTLQQELEYHNVIEFFWTDSKVVLGYINNDARRFHIFVANRVQQIRDHTSPKQWHYIETKNNPADDASRGLSARSLVEKKRWINGSAFLWENSEGWRSPGPQYELLELSPDDKEVKKISVFTTAAKEAPASLLQRVDYFSDWFRAKRAVAVCRRYLEVLWEKVKARKGNHLKGVKPSATQKYQPVGIEELKKAEREIVKQIQGKAFDKEIKALESLRSNEEIQKRNETRKRNQVVREASTLYRLDPFLDKHGVLRVGGRIQQASLSEDIKNPVILPRRGHVTELVIKDFHEKTQHQGRAFTLNEIRSSGYWITGCSSAVSIFIKNCVTCQRLRAKVQEQKMADLPEERLEPSPPFSYCGVDLFGPWYVKEGRKELKRYGVVFTCLASRAVHLEVCHTLETDSFLNALRRFLCRRGPIRQLRADQGSNFIGARRELREALSEMDQDKIKSNLLKMNCDWIEFKFNAPSASHMGGVWERQIRTVRSVLSALLKKNGSQLNDEALRTFMCKAEAVINSRPLTTDNTTSPVSLEALTPNHLLTTKTKIILPPPGAFQDADQYSRKQWRRVQHLTNEFWTRWRKEFLHALQERQKWARPRRNLQIGDVVIIKDDNAPRNQWQLARVTNARKGNDGLVRTVDLAVGDRHLSSSGKRTNQCLSWSAQSTSSSS